ncbi:MAG: DUF1761 domain-containing protein [Minisyncoccia bacterium]
MEVDVNYLAVLAAGVSSMVVGFVWYGWLFRKAWMSEMGYTPESMTGMKMTANKAYVIQFIASLAMACVLSKVILYTGAYLEMGGLEVGIKAAFWMWLGFVVPVSLGAVLWENRTWKLWVINASSYLVTLIVMGIILALWV